jgi:protein-disulfide isomerase
MKEHNTHLNENSEVVENYKEEGAITVESINMHNHSETNHKVHTHKGFTLTTPVAIIIASVIVAFGLMGYGIITQGKGNSTPLAVFKGKAVDAIDFVEGKTNSKVYVIEYSDPECPYCGQVSSTIRQLRADYKGKIAFVYRHFPLTQIHKNAFDESRAIACAGKLGGTEKFYAYIDELYTYETNKQSTQLPATAKEDFARSVGLDMTAFGTCMKENQTAEIVTNSVNDGVTAGVQGTPSTFVLLKTKKGFEQISMVDGARPIDYFKTVIDEALAR